VVLFLAIHVDGEGQVFAGLEEVELFFEEQRVGAEINVFLARDEAFDDLVNLRVHQRLAARDGNHRRAALVYGFEALFRRQFCFQDVGGILNFSAAGAGQVAAEERLELEDERVAFAPSELLF